MSNWDMQLVRIFDKGMAARKAGLPLDACPYKGHRGLDRQRADYWRDGWTRQPEIDKQDESTEVRHRG